MTQSVPSGPAAATGSVAACVAVGAAIRSGWPKVRPSSRERASTMPSWPVPNIRAATQRREAEVTGCRDITSDGWSATPAPASSAVTGEPKLRPPSSVRQT